MDGISIRPIGPGDREALGAAFDRLSPEARYLRFFSPVSRLSGAQLRYLTDVDHHDHEALIAFDEARCEIVGVARFVRTGEGLAEPAVVVADDWQRRGIGSALLDQLADRAREEGVRCFAAAVLAHNEGAIAALRRLGDTRVVNQGREVELEIALPDRRGAGPPLRDLLRRAGERSIQPAVSFLHRVAVGEREREGPPENVIVVAAPGDRRWYPPVARAAALAASLGSELHLVATRGQARLQEVAAELRGRGLVVEAELRRGDVAAALLDVAVERRARLIVVDGSVPAQERFAFTAWDHVAHHAPCDVLVAR